ncbi:MAG TPA: hypothetical protein PLV92_24420 [Pirellulaceae bacterium]|nr:hypothetical protein [Pirellulaceae bacterium]
MSASKQILLKPIDNRAARRILDKRHPLGCGAPFRFAFGVEYEGYIEGVLTFGGPTVNTAVTRWALAQHEVLELRKMWCSDKLPRNSESRALAISLRLIRRHFHGVALLLTYCDDDEKATAYKAAGWTACEAHRYVREVLVGGKWLSVRDANRYRVTDQATAKRYETRRKWLIGVDERGKKIASEVQIAARVITNDEGAV